VIGRALADQLEASLAIEALDMPLAARDPPPRASFITRIGAFSTPCGGHVERLQRHKIAASQAGNDSV